MTDWVTRKKRVKSSANFSCLFALIQNKKTSFRKSCVYRSLMVPLFTFWCLNSETVKDNKSPNRFLYFVYYSVVILTLQMLKQEIDS